MRPSSTVAQPEDDLPGKTGVRVHFLANQAPSKLWRIHNPPSQPPHLSCSVPRGIGRGGTPAANSAVVDMACGRAAESPDRTCRAGARGIDVDVVGRSGTADGLI